MEERQRREQARVVGRSVLANLESLTEGGLADARRDQVAAICRALSGPEVADGTAQLLMGELRVLLVPVSGLAARAFLGWIDDADQPSKV